MTRRFMKWLLPASVVLVGAAVVVYRLSRTGHTVNNIHIDKEVG